MFLKQLSISQYVGKKLREKRKKAGLTLEKISDIIGVTYQQVQKYESGQSKIPINKLYELSILLQTPVDYFFSGFSENNLNESIYSGELITSRKIHSLNILLVENDPFDEFLTRKTINDINQEIKIFSVHCEEQIVNFLQSTSPYTLFSHVDIVFMDINFSKTNYHTILSEIKKNKITQYAPIITLTNNINLTDLLKSYKYGSASFICKSVDLQKFKSDMELCLKYWGEVVILPHLDKNNGSNNFI